MSVGSGFIAARTTMRAVAHATLDAARAVRRAPTVGLIRHAPGTAAPGEREPVADLDAFTA
jgi:hypothetical protein